MDHVNLNAKQNIAASSTAAAIATGQKIKSGTGTAFADLLTFSGNSLSTALNVNTAHPAENAVTDQHRNEDFDHRQDHERPEKTNEARNDDHKSDRVDHDDHNQDDGVRADHDDHESGDHDQTGDPETASSDESNDDQNLSDDTSNDQDKGQEASSEDGSDETTETAQSEGDASEQNAEASGEGAGDQNLSQNTAQTTNQNVDPLIVAAAQSGTAQQTQAQNQVVGEDGLILDPNGAQKQATQTAGQQNNAQAGLQNQNGAQQAQAQKTNQNGLAQSQNIDPELQADVASAVQKQANDLSKKLGQNQQVNINVKVSDAAQTTTSQTSASLTNASAVAANATNQKNQSGTSSNQQGNAQGNMAQNAQAAMMNGQAQNNAQLNNQANQNQNFASMVSDGKGAQQAAAAKGQVAQTVQTGGGETAQVANNSSTQNSAQAQQAAQQKPAHQAKHTHTAQARMDQVNVEINKGIKAGADKINIQLRPADLGRIEIQLEMQNGRVNAVVTADRPDTLEMLKNDARDLQKAMREAGLDLGDMNFNLNQQNNESQQTADGGRSSGGAGGDGEDTPVARGEDVAETEREAQEIRSMLRAAYGGVDLSA